MVSLDDPSYYERDDESETSESSESSSDDDDDTENIRNKKNYTEEDSKLLDKFSKIANGLKKKHGDSQLLSDIIEIGNEKRKEIERGNKKANKKKV